MARYQNRKPITVLEQFLRIKQQYQNLDNEFSRCKRNEMRVRMYITPTADSETYTIDIKYKLNSRPNVFLISPSLKTFNGEKPHHLYGEHNGNPILCLYYPKYKEWTKFCYISDTIIPWISTWLFAYEYWLITGVWHFSEVHNK